MEPNETETGASGTPVKTFNDSSGQTWNPVLSTPVIIKVCRECDITIARLMAKELNIADAIVALWYACEYQARQLGIKRPQFEERLGLADLPGALLTLWTIAQEAFPTLKDYAEKLPGFNQSMKSGDALEAELKNASALPREWAITDLMELAALAGINPMTDFVTPRDLWFMSIARAIEDWKHTATLEARIHNLLARKPLAPEAFHPYRAASIEANRKKPFNETLARFKAILTPEKE